MKQAPQNHLVTRRQLTPQNEDDRNTSSRKKKRSQTKVAPSQYLNGCFRIIHLGDLRLVLVKLSRSRTWEFSILKKSSSSSSSSPSSSSPSSSQFLHLKPLPHIIWHPCQMWNFQQFNFDGWLRHQNDHCESFTLIITWGEGSFAGKTGHVCHHSKGIGHVRSRSIHLRYHCSKTHSIVLYCIVNAISRTKWWQAELWWDLVC